MTTPYTPEERERAEQWLHEHGRVLTEDVVWIAVDVVRCLDRLNRLERREAEARELIDQYEALRCGRSKFYPDFHKVTAWLSEEGV